MIKKFYSPLVENYAYYLKKFGNNFSGYNWPNKKDLITRYDIFLEYLIFSKKIFTVLDVGCGNGGLLDRINYHKLKINYTGIDISKEAIDYAKKKNQKANFIVCDFLEINNNTQIKNKKFDYIVLNGLFTVKYSMSNYLMNKFLKECLIKSFKIANFGIAFNLMRIDVDFKRDDLFYVSFDTLNTFIKKNLSKNFIFRADYKLYEFTTYIFKN
jgi:SAM-dependent methyltransferase